MGDHFLAYDACGEPKGRRGLRGSYPGLASRASDDAEVTGISIGTPTPERTYAHRRSSQPAMRRLLFVSHHIFAACANDLFFSSPNPDRLPMTRGCNTTWVGFLRIMPC